MTLSNPVRFEPNIEMPMRDGVILRANLYRPEGDGPHPVLLSRTPYNKDASTNGLVAALRYASNGYVVVVQDCRGRFASDGVFYPMLNELEDGYDSVEWVAAQPWSNGNVGVFGPSYLGVTTWFSAAGKPPHLKAISPAVTGCDYHDGWYYQSGAFLQGFSQNWTTGNLAMGQVDRLDASEEKKREARGRLMELAGNPRKAMEQLPLSDIGAFLTESRLAPYYADWLAHPTSDDYWSRWNMANHHQNIDVPVLAIGGWYDMFLHGTLDNFTGMRKNGGSGTARDKQRLIIGPWAHSVPLYGANQGEVNFGAMFQGNAIDLDGIVLHWFDRWLKEEDNGASEEPRVKLFTTGINQWQEFEDWPPSNLMPTKYYLHSSGAANSASGDGLLSTEPPDNEPPDVYTYDPRRPVPSRGGGISGQGGAYDQSAIEQRQDVLVYSTPPLEQDVQITGPIEVRLWASTSAMDTDFSAKLVDVSPRGFAMNLADNLVRARYRNSLEKEELLEPGRLYEFRIDLFGASNVFKKGHRIRVDISSSNFPRFNRNPNTGGSLADETELRPALQTIHHDAAGPSHIVLPVMPA